MNLLDKKFVLQGLMGLAVLFTISCEDPGRIGLDVERGILSTNYKEFVLPSSVVQIDPYAGDKIRTTVGMGYIVGSYSDLNFGTTTANTYGQLRLNSLGDSVQGQYDSLIISIRLLSSYGGDPDVPHEIGVPPNH